jgi:hypothetical protein
MMSTGDEHEVPGGLLRVPKELTPAEVRELIERFRSAVRSGRPHELVQYRGELELRCMPDVEEAAGRAYVAFCRKRYGADGVGWDMLSDLERETWRDVVKAVLG